LQEIEKFLSQSSVFAQNKGLCVSRYTHITQAALYLIKKLIYHNLFISEFK